MTGVLIRIKSEVLQSLITVKRNDIRGDAPSDVSFSIVGILALFFRFRFVIKAMTELNEIFSKMFSEDSAEEVRERGFLIEKVRNGESISNSKTLWMEERLQKASDKVVGKLYEKYKNPPSIKIDKRVALEMGEPVCPILSKCMQKV